MPMGFILIQCACVFVFISSSVRLEMEANCVCCLYLALQPLQSERSAACGVFLWKQQQ